MGLAYLGVDPNSMSKDDYQKVVELFQTHLNAIPNKELCMIFNWSGDYATATARAEEAGVDINLEYHIPEAGDGAWFDVWIVPKDAKNIDNAYLFLDYMSRPDVIADCTNYTYYGNANKAGG